MCELSFDCVWKPCTQKHINTYTKIKQNGNQPVNLDLCLQREKQARTELWMKLMSWRCKTNYVSKIKQAVRLLSPTIFKAASSLFWQFVYFCIKAKSDSRTKSIGFDADVKHNLLCKVWPWIILRAWYPCESKSTFWQKNNKKFALKAEFTSLVKVFLLASSVVFVLNGLVYSNNLYFTVCVHYMECIFSTLTTIQC